MNGIIFPSYAHEAVITGSNWVAGYPIQNASDLVRPSKIARATSNTPRSIILTFPAARTVQALAIVGHIQTAGGVAVYAYSGPDATGTETTITNYKAWGASPVAGYRRILPIMLSAPISCRSVLIYLTDSDFPHEIEAIEVGGFWEWPMGFGREIGVATADREVELAGGSSYQMGSNRRARTVSGQVDLMKMEETASTGLDFQKGLDIQRPFVWAEDWTDPASWARKCLLVRNLELSPMVGALYRRDRFPIKLIEHMR